MRWMLIALIVLVVVGGVLWVYTSFPYMLWDGGFDLTVNVSSTAGPLRSVSCQAFGRKVDAEQTLEYLLPPNTRLWSVVLEPYDGEPLTINIPVSGTSSMSDRVLSRYQFRYLVVIAQLSDGRRVGKLVEIPDSRVKREISVSLP